MDKQARMKELIEVLNQASKAYYQEDRELPRMSAMKYSVNWKKRHTKVRCFLLIKQRVQKH